MEKAGSKMIIYHPSLEHLTANCPFQKMPFTPIESIKSLSAVDIESALPRVEDLASGSDVAFVFLTSGSTSGSPKLVPLTQKVFSFYHKVRFGRLLDGKRGDAQDVVLARGNICHEPSMKGAYFPSSRYTVILIHTQIQSISDACILDHALSSPHDGISQ